MSLLHFSVSSKFSTIEHDLLWSLGRNNNYFKIRIKTNGTGRPGSRWFPLLALLLGKHKDMAPSSILGSSSSVSDWTSQVLSDYREAAASPTPSHTPILSTLPPPHPHPPRFHCPSIWQTRVSYPHSSSADCALHTSCHHPRQLTFWHR